MTQKELLYMEDAIGHEKEMISVLSETIELLEDEKLVSYMEDELSKHQGIHEKLLDALEGIANE